MKKTIIGIFLVIAILVIIFIGWSLVYDEGGALETGWNGIADSVNGAWQSVTGGDGKILPEFKGGEKTNLENSGF